MDTAKERINAHGRDRPVLRDLVNHVVPSTTDKWYNLGLQLLDPGHAHVLDTIESEKNDPSTCCRKMFNEWLKSDELASWDKVIKALKVLGLHNAVSNIKDSLLKLPPTAIQEVSMFTLPYQASIDFGAVVSDIAEELNSSCTGTKLDNIKLVCTYTTDEYDIPIFNPTEIDTIKNSRSIYEIFYVIRPHWSWHSHHLLPVIIKRVGSSRALQLLEKFEAKIMYNKKLKDFNEMLIKWNKPIPPDYCKMVGIVDKDYNEIVLEDCFKIDSYISENLGQFQCVEYNKSDSVQFVWLIPMAAVDKLCKKASHLKEGFKKELFISFEICGVIIYDQRIQTFEEKIPDNPLRRLSKISWREGADAPVRNVGENAVLHNGIIYIGGGRAEYGSEGYEARNTASYRIDRYDVASNYWNDKPISSSFYWFSMTTFKGHLVIVGGLDKQKKATKQIFRLEGETLIKYTEMNQPRYASAAIGYQEYLIIAGGSRNEDLGSVITLKSTEVFDSLNTRWHIMNELPRPCWGLQPAIIENKLYLLGGMSETKKPLQTMFTASLDTLSTHILNWDKLKNTVWCRSYPVVMHDKYLLLVGGYNETENSTSKRTNEIQCFGGDTEVVGHIPFERSAPVVVNIDDSTLIVIGGKRNYEKNNAGYLTNTVWIGEVDPIR